MSQSDSPSKRASAHLPLSPQVSAISEGRPGDSVNLVQLFALGGLTLLLVVAYWDMFTITSAFWDDPLYSHGWIVPVFSLSLMWMRWQPARLVSLGERCTGATLLGAGLLIRLGACFYAYAPIERLSFVVALCGAFLLVGGWHVIRWAGPAIGFLVFMFPLPSVLEQGILWRLQTLASACSTFVLQTLGVAAFRQGNVINISGMPLFVADACSGLRMLTIFCALAVAMVFLIERPRWDKFIILVSAVPIALAVNIIRIVVTGLLYMWMGQENEFVNKLAHDWAGYFMMPLALGFLWVELQVLERLTIPEDAVQLRPVGGRRTATAPIR